MMRLFARYLVYELLFVLFLTVAYCSSLFIRQTITLRRVARTPPVEIPAGYYLPSHVLQHRSGEKDMAKKKVYLLAFAIDPYEATNAQYKECVDAGVCSALKVSGLGEGFFERARPVAGLTWQQAGEYCRYRRGRLPGELEWERAARGKGNHVWPWGDEFDGGKLCGSAHPNRRYKPCRAGSFPEDKSAYGLFDVAGNVREWTGSAYPADTLYSRDSESPANDSREERVVRGGSWKESDPDSFKISTRIPAPPRSAFYNVGVRCAY